MTSGIAAAILTVALAPGMVPAEPWTSADEQLNLFEIWNERYGTDYVSNLELEEYRLEDAQLFSVGPEGGSVELVARFDESAHEFGYYTQSDGEIEQEALFDVADWGMLGPGEYQGTLPPDSSFGFYTTPHDLSHTWFSEPALQSESDAGEYKLAVYQTPEPGKLLLAWDANPNGDHNDLVVEVDQGEEGMAMFGAKGLGGLGAIGAGAAAIQGLASSGTTTGGFVGAPVWLWGLGGLGALHALDVIGPPATPPLTATGEPRHTVVPEAETVVILFLGLGALAAYTYRRRRVTAK